MSASLGYVYHLCQSSLELRISRKIVWFSACKLYSPSLLVLSVETKYRDHVKTNRMKSTKVQTLGRNIGTFGLEKPICMHMY